MQLNPYLLQLELFDKMSRRLIFDMAPEIQNYFDKNSEFSELSYIELFSCWLTKF